MFPCKTTYENDIHLFSKCVEIEALLQYVTRIYHNITKQHSTYFHQTIRIYSQTPPQSIPYDENISPYLNSILSRTIWKTRNTSKKQSVSNIPAALIKYFWTITEFNIQDIPNSWQKNPTWRCSHKSTTQFSKPDKSHTKWIRIFRYDFSCFYFRFQCALLSCLHESHPSSYSKSHSRLTLILFTCSDEHIGLRITYTAFVVSFFALPLWISDACFRPKVLLRTYLTFFYLPLDFGWNNSSPSEKKQSHLLRPLPLHSQAGRERWRG